LYLLTRDLLLLTESGKRRPVHSSERAPTSTSLQLSDSNKDLVLSPRWVLYSKADWLTEPSVINITFTLTLTSSNGDTRVKAGSYTSTMTLRVTGGDEKGSLKFETVKYGHESQETWTRERLPGEGQRRASHRNKTITIIE
jgi:hypothetical protein